MKILFLTGKLRNPGSFVTAANAAKKNKKRFGYWGVEHANLLDYTHLGSTAHLTILFLKVQTGIADTETTSSICQIELTFSDRPFMIEN